MSKASYGRIYLTATARREPALSYLWEALTAGIVAGLLGEAIRRHYHKRSARDASSGRPVRVPASIRVLDRGLVGGRWRHGLALVSSEQIRWLPRWPRIGRRFVLRDVVFAKRREPRGAERWHLAPDAVVMPCSAGGDAYELVVPSDWVGYLDVWNRRVPEP